MDRLIAIAVTALVAGVAAAGESSPFDALRAKFPHGVPWKVDIVDADGKTAGRLEVLITSEPASSCLGDMTDGVRVEFTAKDALPPGMSVASYGVAKLGGDKIKIDLTGGICDAYLLMSGTLAADGSSSGDIYTFGMRGGNDVARYRAKIEAAQ